MPCASERPHGSFFRSAIPSCHVDAFILMATLMPEWNTEKEFNRPNSSKEEEGTTQKTTQKTTRKIS